MMLGLLHLKTMDFEDDVEGYGKTIDFDIVGEQ